MTTRRRLRTYYLIAIPKHGRVYYFDVTTYPPFASTPYTVQAHGASEAAEKFQQLLTPIVIEEPTAGAGWKPTKVTP